MKRFFAFLILAFVSGMAFANYNPSSINVVRMAPVGANGALWVEAISQTLMANGYKVNPVNYNNCKDAYNWFKNHDKEPTVIATFSDYAIINKVDPHSKATCNFPVNKDTLITIIGKWWNFICGHKGVSDNFQYLRSSDKLKAGVWNFPISYNVAKIQLAQMGFKGRVVGFASGKAMLMAFSARDIDYIVMSSENMAKSLPSAHCFATSASIQDKDKYMPKRIAYSEVNKNISFDGYGLWPFVAGYNVDNEKIRNVLKDHPGALYKKMQGNLVPDNEPVSEQIKQFDDVANTLKEKHVLEPQKFVPFKGK